MSQPFGKVRTSQVKKSQYVQDNGMPGLRAFTPEAWEMLDKIKALTVTEYLIVESEKEDEDVKNLCQRLQGTFRRMAKVMDLPFRIRLSRNRQKNHVVIWKEPKNGAPVGVTSRIASAARATN